MPRRYSSDEIVKILESQGWSFNRQRGSHMIYTKPGARRHVAVPSNRRQVAAGTLSNIRRQAGFSNEEFQRIANEVL